MAATLELTILYFSNFLLFLIFARAILSWFPQPRNEGILKTLHGGILRIAFTMTEPITGPIRRLIQKSPLGGPGMMLDFSPILAFFLITFVRNFLMNLVAGL